MGCSPKLPHVNLKQDYVTLNQWEFKGSQEPWPHGFRVNMSLGDEIIENQYGWATKQSVQDRIIYVL